MLRMGKTEKYWNGLRLGILKTVQPNGFSKLISAVCNFKNNARETYIFVCLESLILSFPCNFLAYFKFHTDWGRVIGKIKQNELDCRDTAPLSRRLKLKLPFRGMNLNAVNEIMVWHGIYRWSVYINFLKTFVAWSSFLLFLPSTCILSTQTSWHRLHMTSVVREGTSHSDWNCDNCHTTSHLYGRQHSSQLYICHCPDLWL